MRTTIDLPDALFRKTKAIAALQGTSMKELIVRAVEREIDQSGASKRPGGKSRRKKIPVIHLSGGRTLDLTGFDFDDLLA
jgi:hypothetical protein